MSGFETEEQQVEAIKQFWKDNGTAIVMGVVLGIGGLWGWRFYSESQIEAREQASVEYQTSLQALIESKDDSQISDFINQQSKSAYSNLASLILASQAVDDKDLNKAIEILEAVAIDDAALSNIANLRLASVYFQIGETDKALLTLETVTLASFDDQKYELKGDILYADERFDEAESAYNKALLELPGDRNIQMKLNNIAFARVNVSTQESEEASPESE